MAYTASTNVPTYSTYSISNIADGNANTYWWGSRGQQAGDYVQVDLGLVLSLSAVTLSQGKNDTDTADAFASGDLSASADGVTWTTLLAGVTTVVATWTGNTSARYIKFTSTSTNSNWPVVRELSATPDLTGETVSGLSAIPFNGGAQVSFRYNPGSTFDYRLNGGTPVTSQSQNPFAITGLTNGTAYTVEVRPSASGSVGSWSSVTVTPVANGNLYDDFNRADAAPSASALGTAPSGQVWTQSSGTLGIIGGSAYASTNAENHAVISGFGYNADITAITGGTTGHDQSILFRYRDSSNFWMYTCGSDSKHYLYYKKAGGWITLFSNGIPSNIGDTLRLQAAGPLIRAWINGALLIEMEDVYSISTDTSIGIRCSVANSGVDFISAQVIDTSVIPNIPAALSDPYTNGVKSVELNNSASWVYKGRDSKDLDTVGAI